MKLCVAGTGRVGRALASVASARGDVVVVWGPDAATIAAWVESGLAARTTVFPQDEVADCELLVIDGDLEFLGRTLRTYCPGLPTDAVVVETAQPKNDAIRAVANTDGVAVAGSISAVSEGRWLVDVPDSLHELLRHSGIECLHVPARHHDLWRAATELAPALVAAALAETRDDLASICPELSVPNTRLAEMTRPLPDAAAILADRQAALTVLPRVISVLTDTLRWLEFQETERLRALLDKP